MRLKNNKMLVERILNRLKINSRNRSFKILTLCIFIALPFLSVAIYSMFNEKESLTGIANSKKPQNDSIAGNPVESSEELAESIDRNHLATESTLVTWETPNGIQKNNTFSVWVREKGGNWRELSVYTVKNGEQKENDIPTDSAMVNFDFTGEVEIKLTYNKGSINKYEIRPTAYGINAVKEDSNTLVFTLSQDKDAPKKPTVMVNGSWSEGNLHILTNTPEVDAPAMKAKNVYVINPGDSIPLYLPEGKDTYYFAPGIHELPKGMWVELDLKAVYELDEFDLIQLPANTHWFAKGPQRFIIEAKEKVNDEYVKIYNGYDNYSEGTISGSLQGIKVRYIKLTLLGNTGASNYAMASIMSEFKLYKKGDSFTNITKDTAIAGSFDNPGYLNAVDGMENSRYTSSTGYGNWHAGEAFYISQSNTTVYLAPGAVVKGSISADGQSNITIRGRGIMQGGELLRPRDYAEGRSGAIWIAKGNNCTVEGITLLDYPMWSVVMNFNHNPVIKNINFFGSMVNSDGIHLSGSRDGLVSGAFIRTCDDNFVMYHYGPGSNITVKDCLLWADNARPILLGMGDTANANIDHITFENIYIHNQRGVWDLDKYNGAIQLWATGGNRISNISFKNIYIDEFEVPADSTIFQIKNIENGSKWLGTINGITFENVFYKGEFKRKSLIEGAGDNNNIRDILLRNFKINDITLSDNNKEGFIEFRGLYNDVSFE